MPVSRERTKSRPLVASGFYVAQVVRLDGEKVYVIIPRLTSTFEYGPIHYMGSLPAVGDRLLVGFMEGRVDEMAGFTNPANVFTWSLPSNASVKAGVHRLALPFSCVVNTVEVTAGTAPTGDDLIIDLNLNGVTMFTTQGNRPTILAGTQASGLCVPDVRNLVVADYLTVDIDQVGSSVVGADLTVIVWATT